MTEQAVVDFIVGWTVTLNLYSTVTISVNTFLCLLVGFIILWIRSEALSEEIWAWFFGWGFVFFGLIYGEQLVSRLLIFFFAPGLAHSLVLSNLNLSLQGFFSTLNNVFFVSSAYALVNREALSRQQAERLAERLHLTKYKKTLQYIPLWIIILAPLTALLQALPNELYIWPWLSDAFLSAVMLCLLGSAFYRNAKVTNRPRFVTFAIYTVPWLYVACQPFYVVNYILASGETTFWGSLTAQLAFAFPDKTDLLSALSQWIAAPAVLLKLGVAGIGLYFVIRALVILTPKSAHEVLKDVADRRKQYLATEGIVRAIAESTEADFVGVYVVLPKEEPTLLAFEWARPAGPEATSQQQDGQELPVRGGNEQSIIVAVIRTGFEIMSRDWRRDDSPIPGLDPATTISTQYQQAHPGMISFIAVPISYQGGVIGCLNIEWKSTHALGHINIQRARVQALLLAPVLQAKRQMVSLQEIARGNQAHGSSHLADKWCVEQLLRQVTLARDRTNADHVAVFVEVGCFTRIYYCGQDGMARVLFDDGDDDSYERAAAWAARLPAEANTDLRSADIRHHGAVVGRLLVGLRKPADAPGSPSLGAEDTYLNAVAEMVGHALINTIRVGLHSLVRKFQYDVLKSPELTPGALMVLADEAVKSARLAGAALRCDGEDVLPGDPQLHAAFARRDQDAERAAYGDGGVGLLSVPFEAGAGSATLVRTIVEVKLDNRPESLLIGVSHSRFGKALYAESPWMSFLRRMAEVVGYTLQRLDAEERASQANFELIQTEGFASAAMTGGIILHQVTNLIRDLNAGIDNLNAAIAHGEVTVSGTLALQISSMKESADTLMGMIRSTGQLQASQSERPCSLSVAVEYALRVFRYSLAQRRIDCATDVPSDHVVDVSLMIASSAVCNVLKNAIDAVDRNGNVLIQSRDAGDMIECDVWDSGPGVPVGLRGKLFHIGSSTKTNAPGPHGWGLYSVKRSLTANGGDIALVRPGPDGTVFRLRFPKPRPESVGDESSTHLSKLASADSD